MQENAQNDPGILELATMISHSFTQLESRMDKMETRLTGRMDNIETNMATKEDFKQFITKKYLDDRLENLKNELRTELVTKDYLDDKLADLHSDLVKIMKSEDNKLKSLIFGSQRA